MQPEVIHGNSSSSILLPSFFASIEGRYRSDIPAGFVFGAVSSAYQVWQWYSAS